ncbi:MAG: hypothetical protein PHI35_07955 [Victivallaceae bacterium]|nr:hypothetical protein [Victivallaceae bacterium]
MRSLKKMCLSLGFTVLAVGMTAAAAEIAVVGDRLTGRAAVVEQSDGSTTVFTAAHLVAGNPRLRVIDGNGMVRRINAVTFFGDYDIAALECDRLPDLKFRRGDSPVRDCMYVGKYGVIETGTDRRFWRIKGDAVNHGDSGGAVLDGRGLAVAILIGNLDDGGVAAVPLAVTDRVLPQRFGFGDVDRAACSLAAFCGAVDKLRAPAAKISGSDAKKLIEAAQKLDVGDDPADGPVGAARRSEARLVLKHAAAYFEKKER